MAEGLVDIPAPLAHLIHLNAEFGVLLCLGNGCRKALRPVGIAEHLRKVHNEKPQVRKQVQEYINGFPFDYDHATVQLPADGLAPQPILPVVDRLQCKHCLLFKTRSRDAARKHSNKAHDKKRVADEDLFNAVKLQSWFGEKRKRYWVVDESQQPADDN